MRNYGIADISVDASGGPLTASDTNGDDENHDAPKSLPFFAATARSVAIDGLATTVDSNDATSDFTIDAALGVDMLIVDATAAMMWSMSCAARRHERPSERAERRSS